MQDENSLNHPYMDEEAVSVYRSSNSLPRYFILIGNCPSYIRKIWQSQQEKLYRLLWIVPNAEIVAQSYSHLEDIVKDSRIRMISEQDQQQLETLLREDITGIGIWGVNIWAAESMQDSPFYHQVIQIIKQVEAIAVENAYIQYRQGPEIQRNIISNLPYILRATILDQWTNCNQNVPAIIVGAGPSLDRNLNVLKQYVLKQTSACPLIFCVDTALKLLLQNGITPDFVVSCDPTLLNTRHFKDVHLPEKTVFAFLPEIHRSILPSLQHQNLLCLHDKNSNLLNQLLNKISIQTVFGRGMNVGFCAYSLAKALGCSPIILCGMDLALEAGKSSHAQGTANASLVEVDEENNTIQLTGNVHTDKSSVREVDGYYGSTVFTLQHFYLVLQRFAQDIAAHSIPVINATEGGAKIPGTSQMPLLDAVAQYAVTQYALTPNPDHAFPKPIWNAAMMQEVVQQLQTYLHELEQTQESLGKGAYRIPQWLNEVKSKQVDVQTVKTQSQALLKRWQDVLSNHILDTCLDIGLAPLRFDTYRFEVPELDDPAALAQYCHDWLLAHFQAMLSDTEICIQLYTHAIQKLIANHKNFI